MKKKLLFVISQLYKGGAETSLVNLLNHLDYNLYEVELLILNQSPVENAVSLVNRINKKVKVCDAYAEYQKLNVFNRLHGKFVYTTEQKTAYYLPALDFVRNKMYDWAFFIGEWYNPSFVAYEVQAKIKAAWIHNDLSEAEYFDAGSYFYFLDRFDYYIFVSKNSMEASIQRYPFLKDRSVYIYNINDVEYIKSREKEIINDFPKTKLPVLLTCGNFRTQKNHLRQVKVMAELKRRGIEFIWVNIGATTDKEIVNQVKLLCAKEQLLDRFFILGPKENPYAYIKQADAVTVLSDYESWSMVITESKIVGTPIIATKTSGALEQIVHEETGLLTEFEVEDMADKIEEFICNEQLRKKIKDNINNFDNTTDILESFSKLITEGKSYKNRRSNIEEKSILYIIDDINYMGGAHVATKLQIKEFVKSGRNVAVFSAEVPNITIRKQLQGVQFLSWKDFPADILFNKKVIDCFTNKFISKKDKRAKLKQIWDIKVKKNSNYYEEIVLPQLSNVISEYDVACVMSEGSAFRKAVALSTSKKIQWIHIDYCVWREKAEWNKKVTMYDGELYKKFDNIVVLTENIKESFCELYPHLSDKVIVNRNLMPVEEIKRKAQGVISKKAKTWQLISIEQLENLKEWTKVLQMFSVLKKKGYHFCWNIIGSGNAYWSLCELVEELDLTDNIKFYGELENPYRDLKKADMCLCLLNGEDTLHSVCESLMSGTPVLAIKSHEIREEIQHNENGWIVEKETDVIQQKIEWIFTHEEELKKVKYGALRYCLKAKPLEFVTVARLDYQKNYPRLLKILYRMKNLGYEFHWSIIGDGDEKEQVKGLVDKYELSEYVTLCGQLSNPFSKVKQADVFALLSDFEGIPNTIYEALILGVPVLATNVGGVSTQIEDGKNGWLVNNSETAILEKLEWLMVHPEEVEKIRNYNISYHYDNQDVMKINKILFE